MSTSDPFVAVLPYGFKPRGPLGSVPLKDVEWPLGAPLDLNGTLADLTRQDHVVTYPRNWVYGWKPLGLRARLSLLIVEPAAIHKKHMRLARLFSRRFHRILTCNPTLLARLPNAQFFPLGDTWVENWQDVDCHKTQMASLIASAKRGLEGHQLRHSLADWVGRSGQDVKVMGGGYAPFAAKSEGLAPFRYSFIIENAAEPGYFTEKLIDALLCETVPVYWGAPDIERFFDPNGMLICRTFDDLKAAAANLSDADYRARRDAILANKSRAQTYIDVNKRAAKAVI